MWIIIKLSPEQHVNTIFGFLFRRRCVRFRIELDQIPHVLSYWANGRRTYEQELTMSKLTDLCAGLL
jgi:hypothetical protein